MRLSGYESRKVVMIPMVIGEKIRRARQQAGFSQAELAAVTGIPLNNMCSYEEGTMDPEIQEQVRPQLQDFLQRYIKRLVL